ncbi:MAG TPA: c-type cytochrome, partial [Tepidisphaeraceae bacterium]|nr:c-type cytochrome [Tepidisphaeraceae bacterium]
LCRTLTYLDSPTVIAKSMGLLSLATTQEDQLFYVSMLRSIKDGWTLDQRKAWFSWLNLAEEQYHGGASFKKFLQHFREEAESTLTSQEKEELAPIINKRASVAVVKTTTPRQFVRNWQMQDLLPDLDEVNHGRSFERGRAAYQAVQCSQCHKFQGEGDGSIGPDLTGVGNRFTAEYILESILLPSKVVSDQYANTQIVTKDHDVVIGKVMQDESDKLVIRPSPLSEATVTVLKKDIARQELSKLSPMPEGLVDTLTKDEIYDMIAFLRSAGNSNDKAFKS